MPFALSADKSNPQTDFCGKGPLFLERVTYLESHVYVGLQVDMTQLIAVELMYVGRYGT